MTHTRNKKINRSTAGNVFLFIVLGLGAAFMALPIIFLVNQAFKPINELFLFPPQFFVRNPTLDNFRDLFILMSESWVPFTRYLFNSIIIVYLERLILFASMGAYVIVSINFPVETFNKLVVLSLMFAPQVTAIPITWLCQTGWINNLLSVIVPAWAYS